LALVGAGSRIDGALPTKAAVYGIIISSSVSGNSLDGRVTMQKRLFALVLGTTVMLSACETHRPEGATAPAPSSPVASAATGANVLEGAAVDAPIAGLAGAVWSDPNNTGYVTGYTYKGQYHPGAPPGYNPATHSVEPGH